MANTPKKQILIVEDELPMVSILKNKLKNDYSCSSAKNGIEGLEKAKKNKPDLILLDLLMPKMDGMKMLKKLRASSWGKNMKVVILSNLTYTDKEKDEIFKIADDYLIKSNWEINEVIAKIKKILS